MKLLVVSDFHGKSSADNNLEEFLTSDYDLLIILGDLTHLGPSSQAEEILDRIEESNISTLAVPGNCDPKSVHNILEERGISLHSKAVEFEDLTFVGFGGSNTTPFNTSFEFTEGEIEEELNALACNIEGGWILVSHVPPYGTKADLTSDDIHVGSKSVRNIIEKKQPLVNFCAHVHEARSIDKIGKTKIVNGGPISKGYAVEAELNGQETSIRLLEL
ncbi:MAG: metallophosphoesterase family protein [Hadesarchaea archaeon]|nr:metallophosphoesterase family protein [Hadesarchaea archaeon]